MLEEDQNSLDFHRFNSQETIMMSNSPTSEELIIAPGEGKQQKSILKVSGKPCDDHDLTSIV